MKMCDRRRLLNIVPTVAPLFLAPFTGVHTARYLVGLEEVARCIWQMHGVIVYGGVCGR
jgi:hypothetical protein